VFQEFQEHVSRGNGIQNPFRRARAHKGRILKPFWVGVFQEFQEHQEFQSFKYISRGFQELSRVIKSFKSFKSTFQEGLSNDD